MSSPLPIVRPVILCGGSGTRLWPASREAFPKQFAPIIGEHSTFQETLLRVSDPALFGRPLIIANAAHRFMAERQMREIGVECDILLEPVARDSGPAIAAGSLLVARQDPEALVLILASDHMVLDPAGFRARVDAGRQVAAEGAIVTFGITPTSPATGYGYIEPGEPLAGAARAVRRFVEKPDRETAIRYLASGYLWNSGNFLFRPTGVLAEYAASDPDGMANITRALDEATHDLGVPILAQEHFLAARKISFDYAVMERTTRAAVVAGDFGWSDIGGWDALWAISPQDAQGNAGHGDVLFHASSGNYASSEHQLLTLLGVEDLVVVATRDAVLVADKARAGEVKGIVESLRDKGREEARNHARVFRPWGWYQTLDVGEKFQVKRVILYPGGRQSLQKHARRSEHWVIVKGTARARLGDLTVTLVAEQSTYIPVGMIHRLENAGTEDLEIIEVQSGAYLGEDDIVRIEDDYRRT